MLIHKSECKVLCRLFIKSFYVGRQTLGLYSSRDNDFVFRKSRLLSILLVFFCFLSVFSLILWQYFDFCMYNNSFLYLVLVRMKVHFKLRNFIGNRFLWWFKLGLYLVLLLISRASTIMTKRKSKLKYSHWV